MKKEQSRQFLYLVILCIGLVCGWCLKDGNADREEKQNLLQKIKMLKAQVEKLTDKGDGIYRHGQLMVREGRLWDEHGETVVLRGLSSHGVNWYPRYTNASALATLKAYGANVFRIAMYTQQEGGYIYEPKQNKNYVYMAVENALSQDMYAIIDWHILRDENPLVHMAEAKAFFEELSAQYADSKGVIYEICNEPNSGTTWEEVCMYAEEVIPIIRKHSPNAVIIVGTPEYCTRIDLAMEAPLPYENLLYSYHKYIDVSADEEFHAERLERAAEAGFPIFVSEWGISYGDLDDSRILHYQDEKLNFSNAYAFAEKLREYDISWCAWSLSNKSEAYSLILNSCPKLSGWQKEDMTPAGWFMVQLLQKYKEEL